MRCVQVLHVDDDEQVCELTSAVLGQDADFEVSWLTDPRETMDAIRERNVDCVVSDYDMPHLDGLALLERVRERYPDLPFILFTGKGSEEIASDAISAGVTDYLQKGTGTEQYELLATRIRNAVASVRAHDELQESQRRLQTLLSNLPGMSYRCLNEPEWPMEFVSQGCRELTGYEPRAFESDEVAWGEDVIDDRDADQLWDIVQDALAEGQPFEVVYRIRTKGDERKWVWEQGRGVYEDGELQALEGIIMDVTEYDHGEGDDGRRLRQFDGRVAERVRSELGTARDALEASGGRGGERERALAALDRAEDLIDDVVSFSQSPGESEQ
jgi:FixJ family two-component response regulator